MLAPGYGFLVIYGEYYPLCCFKNIIWATIDYDKVFPLSFIVHYISVDLLHSLAFSKHSLPSHIYKQHPTSRKIQLLFSKVVKKEQHYLRELQVNDKNDRDELLLYIAITDEATSERFVLDLWGGNGVFSYWNESLKFTIFQKIFLKSPWRKCLVLASFRGHRNLLSDVSRYTRESRVTWFREVSTRGKLTQARFHTLLATTWSCDFKSVFKFS